MRGVRKQPVFLRPDGRVRFPDPEQFDKEGLVAVGGDLSSARLLAAYQSGIFPWYAEGYVPMWWSPDPRALLDPEHLHVSRSMHKRLRREDFQLTWNRCFPRVMAECGRLRKEGTWVIPEMVEAYCRLHREGFAHSLEVWRGPELVGGTYGVQVGGLFAAESMFHRATDMSKVAVIALVRSLFAAGITLLDVQFVTSHLATLGAFSVPRSEYLARVAVASSRPVDLTGLVPSWTSPGDSAAADAASADPGK
ncbi:MAG: leucyl/phenylalanyl-tRNA--protein transferase [Planctomycetes bacterium]|jgi:leucyl/phenylalanyl-tRNA--protein transferase|nr:leucyl/phenylalanyl-tRNA--protein transferase [Planctomycetota bacterium]MCC7062523.1 leucyl/phenylalanyl-tRNA--protein transferase [Planctomycetota bacterium]